MPADFRTTGNNKDNTHYTYWGDGGFSWAIPYLTELAGLAWGIDESLTIEQIFELLIETKTETASGKLVINPDGFIEVVTLRNETPSLISSFDCPLCLSSVSHGLQLQSTPYSDKSLLAKDNLVSTREVTHIDEAIDDILVSPALREKVIGGTVIPTSYSDHPAYFIDISL